MGNKHSADSANMLVHNQEPSNGSTIPVGLEHQAGESKWVHNVVVVDGTNWCIQMGNMGNFVGFGCVAVNMCNMDHKLEVEMGHTGVVDFVGVGVVVVDGYLL